jgi:hypothetical protein
LVIGRSDVATVNWQGKAIDLSGYRGGFAKLTLTTE